MSATQWTKKNWDLSSLSYTQPFKGKRVTRKKKSKGTLTVPFVVDDIPPEHKFPGLGAPGPDVKCFKQIYFPGLAVVGNMSNTDKGHWGQRTIVPAHSVLDLKGKAQLCLFALVFSEWCFLQRETFPK